MVGWHSGNVFLKFLAKNRAKVLYKPLTVTHIKKHKCVENKTVLTFESATQGSEDLLRLDRTRNLSSCKILIQHGQTWPHKKLKQVKELNSFCKKKWGSSIGFN